MAIERITVSIDKEFAEELRRIAKNKGKSLSKLIRDSLQEWLIDRERKEAGMAVLKLIEEKGKLVSDEALKEIEAERRASDRDRA
ncbi:CopG family ribbon-helix-helix protein [Desulfurobacterium crinifex]